MYIFIIADLHTYRDVDNTSNDVCQERLDEIRVHLDRHVHNIKYHHEEGDGEAYKWVNAEVQFF